MKYKNYLVLMLMTVLAFSYVDRMVFGIALEHIKTDLHLTDTELGLLSGIGFFLFFALMGIPIARWADRGDRVAVVSVTTAVWSIAVSLCGMAVNFVQLFLVRIGVAAGEAGCGPPASSLIPEYFSRAERPRAFARYYLGSWIGLAAGYFAGGWLIELHGWRMTFLVVGLPGILLATFVATTLREPRRQKTAPVGSLRERQPGLKEVVLQLWANAAFRNLLLFNVVWYFCGWGVQQWLPTFFIRTHGLSTGELGTALAVLYGTIGILGTWLGGEWGSRYTANNERLQLILAGTFFFLEALFYTAAVLVPNHYWAWGALALATLVEGLATGPIFATIQTLVPTHMRARAQALQILLPSFLGAGLGPLLVGTLSDAFQPFAAEQSLRYALLVLCPGFCWAACHLWRASRTVTRDVAAVERFEQRRVQERDQILVAREHPQVDASY